MPVARYFILVGGVLLALLFAVDAFAPQQDVVASNATPAVDTAVVRIRSDKKLPDRVVYDTSLPTIVPPAATVRVAAAPVPPIIADDKADKAHAGVRDTFAQLVPAEAAAEAKEAKKETKKSEPQVQRKRKIAKIRSNPPTRVASNRPARVASNPPMRVAQRQPQFGFFGGWGWNNTW
jgi:hypothetical protein